MNSRKKKKHINLSVIIIAKDEEEKLPDCLESVRWAGEVVVIDNDSTDNTAKIAKKAGAKVYKASDKLTLKYSDLRNFGLKKARGEWVLYIDADERVTPKLRNEISELISNFQFPISNEDSNKVAFAIPRRNVIFGKEMRHGGLWPDYVKRLFLKKHLKKWVGEVHEEPVFKGGMGHLKNHLVHLKHNNLEGMVTKTNKWSEIEAKLMFDADHPPMNVFRFITAMWREFWLRMVRQLAFLDGAEGIIYGLYQVYSRFISYAKLWEMQIKDSR